MTITAPSTAAKLPPLGPGEFRLVTNALTADEGGQERRRFRAVVSSTITDLLGNTISLNALTQMRDDFRAGLPVFMDHDYTNVVDKVFGISDTADIVQTDVRDERTNALIYDLVVSGPVNEPNPKAVQLHDSIIGGYVKLGASIGAIVRKHKRDRETGGMLIESINVKEVSIVGIPKNQRSMVYKASHAAADLPEDADLSDDDEPEEVEQPIEEQVIASNGEPLQQWVVTPSDTTITTDGSLTNVSTTELRLGDLSSKARNDMPAGQFACPEKRLYPIHDAAHVRAALSRVADPSNDQCGKSAILAAARKMGIGDHKASITDDELLTWALDNPVEEPAEIAPEAVEATETGAEDETTPGGQEADAATPETAPATPDATDPAIEQQADIEVEDVAALVQHVKGLVEEVGRLRVENERLVTENASIKAGFDRLSGVERDATEAINKVMSLPLRRQAVGHVDDLINRYPGLDPRVTAYIARATTQEKE